MENLHAIFMTEAQELITEFEKSLLILDSDLSNKDGIASVFRTIHTLKGSASMFGFDNLSQLTHIIESIYDLIRNDKMLLTQNILSITLKSSDHLKKILDDPDLKNKSVKKEHQQLLLSLESISNQNIEIPQETITIQEVKIEQYATYYLLFIPNKDILINGTNTLYLFDDLIALGEGITLPYFNQMPGLKDIIPDLSYTCFETILYTNKGEDQIREVFMFVESFSHLFINKISDNNLLKNRKTVANLEKAHNYAEPFGEEKILSILLETVKVEQDKAEERISSLKNTNNVRVSSERLDELMNHVSELVTTQASLSLLSENLSIPELKTLAEGIEKITRRLRDTAFSMSLVPIESLVVRYQRLVRDLSRELKKDVIFLTEGTETEIEKSIIERLTEILLHVIRNSLDHGIESDETRLRLGKPAQGTLMLKSYYLGANVIIEISDDGAGINTERLRVKAEERGLITSGAILNKKELLNLIFHPGLSTANEVSDISGRGVGMDVVKRRIAEINGDIEVDSTPNKGTKVTIKLPPSLSIMDGLLLQVHNTYFILPLSIVEQIYGITYRDVNKDNNNLIVLAGEMIPYFLVRNEFDYERYNENNQLLQAVVVKFENQKVALIIDKVIGEYQAVLKPIGKLFKKQDFISGVSILGDGTVAIVLDPGRIVRRFVTENEYVIQ